MSLRTGVRQLRFADVDAVLEEIARLRKQGYLRRGNWTLGQMAWHLGRPLAMLEAPPPGPEVQRTAEQEQKKRYFVDHILATRTAPPGVENAPPQMVPPRDAGEGDIDQFEAGLRKLRQYPHARIVMGPIGPVTIEEFTTCNIFHAEHHLAFLEPKAEAPARREGLRYADEDEVIAEIRRLRRFGYARAGAWSLAQACWHLETTTRSRMKEGPFPPNTPEQDARRAALQQVLATGRLPTGITAPDEMVPPVDAGEAAIKACVTTLERFKGFGGVMAPHRIFGHLSPGEMRRLNLIHCAHHLGYLVPNE